MTHYCPRATPGSKGYSLLRRVALCGAECVAGPTQEECEQGLQAGSSRPEHVDCPECKHLGADAALDRALVADVDALTDPGPLDHERSGSQNCTREEQR